MSNDRSPPTPPFSFSSTSPVRTPNSHWNICLCFVYRYIIWILERWRRRWGGGQNIMILCCVVIPSAWVVNQLLSPKRQKTIWWNKTKPKKKKKLLSFTTQPRVSFTTNLPLDTRDLLCRNTQFYSHSLKMMRFFLSVLSSRKSVFRSWSDSYQGSQTWQMGKPQWDKTSVFLL